MQPARVCRAVLQQSAEQLLQEDQERVKDGHPLRVAVAVPVDVELNDVPSEWVSLPDGQRIWQQSIKADGAGGLILSFDELYIPEGGVLYVYSADRTQVQRIVHEDNRDGGVYALPRFMDDEVLLEYVQPADGGEAPRIKASGVGYIYRNARALGDDLSCFIDVHCEEGDNWQVQKNGVVGMWMNFSNSWYVCTGSLVNNVRQDGTPFVLTAHHCIDGYSSNSFFSTMEFDFFKESTKTGTCHDTSDESPLTRTLVGCELVADIPLRGASDGTLLKLTKAIPEDWNVYYNGWDARGEVSQSGVGIHHPNALVKKISTYNTPLRSVSRVNIDGDITGTNTHWEVAWAETTNGWSVTYGGSSGSPLFNSDGLIVGTLTGGDSYCEVPTGKDVYGKFSYHFSGYTNSAQHFKNYLDPDNTGTLVLGGYDPHADTSFGNSKVAVLPASDCSADGFTARWEPLEGATDYRLSVYTKPVGATKGTVKVDFNTTQVPDGWIASATDWYTSEEYSGENVPSFKLAKNPAYLQSPDFPGPISSIRFWYRGASTQGSDSELTVFVREADEAWKQVKSISPLNDNGEEVLIDNLPTCNAVQFEYRKVKGNCALDDIVIDYGGSEETLSYLDGYEDRSVGNVQEHRVAAPATDETYYYKVQATDGESWSKWSDEMKVCDAAVYLPLPELSSFVLVRDGQVVVRRNDAADTRVSVYNLMGQQLWSQTVGGYEFELPYRLESGIYSVRVGNESHKVVVP